MKTISVVTPCFNEEDGIRTCYETVRDIFSNKLSEYRLEHIFCDNASSDGTVEILRELASVDPAVRVIVNARDFGASRSCFNGVLSATGDAVLIFLPADLQDPPELIPEFVNLWQNGYEIVYGIRAVREEGFILRNARKLYYRALSKLSDLSVPPDVGDFQLVDRKVVEGMRQVKDVYPYMRMMTFECGFRAVGVSYTWKARRHGKSNAHLKNLLDLGLKGFVTFTKAPVRLALYGGFLLAAACIIYSIFSFIYGMIYYQQIAAPGVVTIITAMFFFGGVQMFFLGMIGEYILQIYSQVRQAPLVVERERINFDSPAQDRDNQEN